VKSAQWLLLMYLLAFSLFPAVRNSPVVEKYRPEELKPGKEETGIITLFTTLLKLTLALVILKLVGFKLRWIIDVAVFVTGYIFGDIFGVGFPMGLFLLALRKSENVDLYNISSALTIVFFSLIISRFVPTSAAILFIALLSLYDVIGVLYLPYIKFLWLKFSRINFDGVAIVSSDGFVGAGDYALPLLFSLSFGFFGLLSLPLFLLAFYLTSLLSRRFGAFPGLPLQAFFAYAFYLAFS